MIIYVYFSNDDNLWLANSLDYLPQENVEPSAEASPESALAHCIAGKLLIIKK